VDKIAYGWGVGTTGVDVREMTKFFLLIFFFISILLPLKNACIEQHYTLIFLSLWQKRNFTNLSFIMEVSVGA